MNEAEKNSLIEEFMPEVEEIAEEISDGTVPMEDLVQEGYVGLLEGIAQLAASRRAADDAGWDDVSDTEEGSAEAVPGAAAYGTDAGWDDISDTEEASAGYSDFPDTEGMSTDDIVRGAVREAMRKAQEAAASLNKTNDSLVVQVDLLNQSIDRLTEELGMKPNIDEIANDMKIPQDKVLDILKLTGEDIDAEDAAANRRKPEDGS